MKVSYDVRVDGWTQIQTKREPVFHGYITISDKAWDQLKGIGVRDYCIPCRKHLSDNEHLIAVASYIDLNE